MQLKIKKLINKIKRIYKYIYPIYSNSFIELDGFYSIDDCEMIVKSINAEFIGCVQVEKKIRIVFKTKTKDWFEETFEETNLISKGDVYDSI